MEVKFSYITWTPPKLTEEEEFEYGRQIAIQGREFWIKEFQKNVYRSVGNIAKQPPPQSKSSNLVGGVVLIVCLLGICLDPHIRERFVRLIVVLSVFACAILFGSIYLAKRQFNHWVNGLVAKYAAHVAKGGYPHDSRN